MPSNYTDLPFWENGVYVKPVYRSISVKRFVDNIKRIILLGQSIEFARINATEGISYLSDFDSSSIYSGITNDVNGKAVFIIASYSPSEPGNIRVDKIRVNIIATTGPQNTQTQGVDVASLYLHGIHNILESAPDEEFVWREQMVGEDLIDYNNYLFELPKPVVTFEMGQPDRNTIARLPAQYGVQLTLTVNIRVECPMNL